MSLPQTLGELRRSSGARPVPVRDEMRANLLRKLRAGETLFPGVLGYDDTVVPQVVNAVLSRHNMILLGLRGQAKSRLLRSLTTLLDPVVPAVAGSEIHDDPFRPLSASTRGTSWRSAGTTTPLDWLTPDGPLRGEARDARRHDRRHHRRRRPHPGRPRRPRPRAAS